MCVRAHLLSFYPYTFLAFYPYTFLAYPKLTSLKLYLYIGPKFLQAR